MEVTLLLELSKTAFKGLQEHVDKDSLMRVKNELFEDKFKHCVWWIPGTIYHLANATPLVRHDVGSMLWRCFLAAGTGKLASIDRRMNAAKYLKKSFSWSDAGGIVELSARQWPKAYNKDNAVALALVSDSL